MLLNWFLHGAPETFSITPDAYKATYIFSGNKYYDNQGEIFDGGSLNIRNWDMYKDKNQLELIKNVRVLNNSDFPSEGSSNNAYSLIGQWYLVNNMYYWYAMDAINGQLGGRGDTNGYSGVYGVRLVVELEEGVYIASGSGTGADPYILGKD